jgi:DNA-binding NarL/FixJ family response regulator
MVSGQDSNACCATPLNYRKKPMVKVLIADDSLVVRHRLVTMLSEVDEIEVVGQAETGSEGIELVERLHPDVVILDIRMPQGDGISALEAIKTAHPDVIVIMLTNYPYPQYKKKCEAAGADFFFDKSSEFEKVTEVLEQLAQNKP